MKHVDQLWSNTSNIAALNQAQSGWLDLSKHGGMIFWTRTVTGGTYVAEIDWSTDGGSTVASTDTPIPAVDGVQLMVQSKARWCRLRVKNTHATNAFTSHSTVVLRDAGAGRAG